MSHKRTAALSATQIADSYLPGRIPEQRYLDRDSVALLLQLHQAGKTQVEIAQTLKIDQSNVSRWLTKLTDTTDLAKHRLKNAALTLAERVIDDADVEQALEVLDRLEVAPKRQADTGRGGNVLIHIGMPGSPIGPDPVIDLSPVPRNELTEKSTG